MENQTAYKLWSYEFVHYAPSTPKGGGKIKWNKVSEYREIYLPSDVTDPENIYSVAAATTMLTSWNTTGSALKSN
jgi:hypothetical protein